MADSREGFLWKAIVSYVNWEGYTSLRESRLLDHPDEQ